MTDIKPVALAPSSVAAFTEAMRGPKGTLDAWLEVNNEAEVRAHVEAYAEQAIDSLQAEVDDANDDFELMSELAINHKARAERAEAEVEALREVLAKIDGIAELALRFNAAREGRE